MLSKKISIKAKVWRWPGDLGWYFVTLDKDLANKIRKSYPKGFVKIHAQIGKYAWQTSLFPHKQAGYLICLNKKVRQSECIFENDIVSIKIQLV